MHIPYVLHLKQSICIVADLLCWFKAVASLHGWPLQLVLARVLTKVKKYKLLQLGTGSQYFWHATPLYCTMTWTHPFTPFLCPRLLLEANNFTSYPAISDSSFLTFLERLKVALSVFSGFSFLMVVGLASLCMLR
jgi:hypothetical protein